MHRTTLVLAGIAASALMGAPAQAYPAQQIYVPEDYEASEHFDAGENACVAWAGTFHEIRTGGYNVLLPPGGQVDGEVHVNGSIDGYVELVPDNPGLPRYSGEYREKNNVIVTSLDQEGDDTVRVGQYRLRLPMTGTDGSTLVIRLSGKITVDPTGRLVVAKDTFTCV